MGLVQWESEGYYLYGLVEPKSGDNFFFEFSHMDSTCFEIYLREFALTYPVVRQASAVLTIIREKKISLVLKSYALRTVRS